MQYPPNYQLYPGPPQQPPLPHQKFLQWFRRLSRRAQIASVLILVLSCCTCSGITAAANNGSQTAQITPTVTAAQQQADQQTPTQAVQLAATTKPTATPTTEPTPTPKPTPKPTPRPTQPPVKPTPTPTPHHTGVNGNPWGYDFNPGNLIYQPNSDFCAYFACVSTFWTATNGYVVECANSEYSHSGGVRGACSRDGGVARALYSH